MICARPKSWKATGREPRRFKRAPSRKTHRALVAPDHLHLVPLGPELLKLPLVHPILAKDGPVRVVPDEEPEVVDGSLRVHPAEDVEELLHVALRLDPASHVAATGIQVG